MLLVDGIIFSLQQEGGISVYFRELLSRLARAEVPASIQVYDAASVDRLRSIGLPILHRKARALERYRRCSPTTASRLFHSSYYRLPATRTLPVVTTVYDFVYERCVGGPRRWVHSFQKFSAIRRSDAIICISNSTQRDLHEFLPDVPAGRVRVIHLGANDSFQPIARVEAASSPRAFVLFVGARARYKNFSVVVKALSRLPGLRLLIVGGGALADAEKAFLERSVGGRYEHLGNVAPSVLNKLYSSALCLAYPSSYEGFGIPIVEAMRSGCPVIAVRASSIPEVAGQAAVMLDAPEPELLRAAIEKLLEPAEHQRFRERGIARAQEFSWDRTFNETIAVYEGLIGRPLRA